CVVEGLGDVVRTRPGNELTPLERAGVPPAQLRNVTEGPHLTDEAGRYGQMKCDMQKQILAAQNQCCHRSDLRRTRPLPELCDWNAHVRPKRGGPSPNTKNALAYVDQRQSLGVRRFVS